MSLPEVRVDGVLLDKYLSAAVKNAASSLVQGGSSNEFWSTSERFMSDPTIEVLEVNLNGARLLNHIAFSTAHFPHMVTAEWWDADVRTWEPVRTTSAATPDWRTATAIGKSLKPEHQGEPVIRTLWDSLPVKVNTAATAATLTAGHPQHYGAGHWEPVTWRITPITTSRLRLLLRRIPGVPPALPTGDPAAYSLGVRDLQMGYRVLSRADVPPAAAVTGTSFGGSVDLLGSRVSFSVREQRAIDVLRADEGTGWRSEPMPVNYAVVNFYVDTRTGGIDPLTGKPITVGDGPALVTPVRLTPDIPDLADTDDATALVEAPGVTDADAGKIVVETLPGAPVLWLRGDFTAGQTFPYVLSVTGADGEQVVATPTATAAGIGTLETISVPLADLDLPTLGDGPYTFALSFAADPDYPGSGATLAGWWIEGTVTDRTGPAAGDGTGQVIDRFYLDPLTVGAHLNLYYSNDDPTGEFKALDEPIGFPLSQSHGVVGTGALQTTVTIADRMIFPATAPAFVDIDNAYLQFDHTKAWWLGLAMVSQTGPDGVAGGDDDHPWLTFGGNTLRQVGGNIEFIAASGKVCTVPVDPDGHLTNADFTVSVVFNPTDPDPATAAEHFPKGLTLIYHLPGRESVSETRDITVEDLGFRRAASVSIGRYDDRNNPGTAAMTLTGLVLKVEQAPERAQIDLFTQIPEQFALSAESAASDLGLTDNALLRAHASYADGTTNPLGLVGGPGDRYHEMRWTPIHRDYALKQGFLHVPPTRAKYWKFEFTQLVAEHYENFVPIRRTVKLFPTQTVQAHAALTSGQNWSASAAKSPGVQTAVDLTDVSRYADAVNLLRTSQVDTAVAHTATEMLYVHDITAANRIASEGWVWRFQPWHIGSSSPKFVYTQRHQYETVSVEHRSQVAFFVGIKRLEAYRVDYLVDDDTEQYDEHFHDQVNVASTTDMVWDTNRVTSFSASGEVVSKDLTSKRPVRGVQFATIQSDSYPLLPDDGFVNPALDAHWRAYGDASLKRNPDRTVLVNRGFKERAYGDIETTEALDTYGEMDTHLYGELEGDLPTGLSGGGLSSEPITPSNTGRIYAAAKVSAAANLSGPVTLELVAAEGDVVLASAERWVTAGQEETFHIGYEVGSAVEGLTYDDIEGTPYGDLDATAYADHETVAIDSDIYARIQQPGRFDDAFLINRLSVFDAAFTWEFSNDGGTTWWDGTDVRNDPDGVLMLPTEGRDLRWRLRSFHPGASVSALAIRPWYAGLLGSATSHSGQQMLGPNRSVVDDYPDIHDDPMWQQSDSPIPASWYNPPQPLEFEPDPEPVIEPVPEPPAPEPDVTGLVFHAQTAAFTGQAGPPNHNVILSEFPQDMTAATVLNDGTVLVAVWTYPPGDTNDVSYGRVSHVTPFIRILHYDADLNLLGSLDWVVTDTNTGPNEDSTGRGGIAFLPPADDSAVTLLLQTNQDYTGQRIRNVADVVFDGTSYLPDLSTSVWVGTAPYIQISPYAENSLNYGQLTPGVIGRLGAQFHLDAPATDNVNFRGTMGVTFTTDAGSSNPDRRIVIESVTGTGPTLTITPTDYPAAPYDDGTWSQWNFNLTPAHAQTVVDIARLGDLYITVDPGGTGQRVVTSIDLTLNYNRPGETVGQIDPAIPQTVLSRSVSFDATGAAPAYTGFRRYVAHASCYDFEYVHLLSVPSRQCTIVQIDGSSYTDPVTGQHPSILQMWHDDGRLLDEVAYTRNPNGNSSPIGLFLDPADDTRFAAVDDLGRVLLVTGLDTAHMVVTEVVPKIYPAQTLNWPKASTSPFEVGPGLIDDPDNADGNPALIGESIHHPETNTDLGVVSPWRESYHFAPVGVGDGRVLFAVDSDWTPDGSSRSGEEIWLTLVDYRDSTAPATAETALAHTADLFPGYGVSSYDGMPYSAIPALAASAEHGLAVFAWVVEHSDETTPTTNYQQSLVVSTFKFPRSNPGDPTPAPAALPAPAVEHTDVATVAENLFLTSSYPVTGPMTQIAPDTTHVVLGGAGAVTDNDDATYLSLTTPAATGTYNVSEGLGVRLAPWAAPAGAFNVRLSVSLRHLWNTDTPGATAPYMRFYAAVRNPDGTVTSPGYPSSAAPGNWGTVGTAITDPDFVLTLSPAQAAALKTGDLVFMVATLDADTGPSYELRLMDVDVLINYLV